MSSSDSDPGAGHDSTLDYHHRMISDPHRVVAYHRAIERLVRPGDVVLDAGAGTGLLSMLAARAGASRVYAVESMAVIDLARELVHHNGLADRVQVIRADLRDLPPMAEVDLIVSDCLGRFLVDDHMLDAMSGAFRWLRPGGRVAPRAVTLMLAPVSLGHFGVLDGFLSPILGLDFAPAARLASELTWAASVADNALLAPVQAFATWHLPGPLPSFDGHLTFTLTQPGRLRGLAGWFSAELADDVVLDTRPGVESHWNQLILPLPPLEVEAGDELHVQVRLAIPKLSHWSRTGRLVRRGETVATFDLGHDLAPHAPETRPTGTSEPTEPAEPSDPIDAARRATPATSRFRTPEGLGTDAHTPTAEELDELGAELWDGEDPEAVRRATAYFEDASLRLAPGEWRPGLWENLGIAYVTQGRWVDAVTPLFRALDGDLASREQSLRLLVDACFHAGRHQDGARYLEAYHTHFGPHPAGWHR